MTSRKIKEIKIIRTTVKGYKGFLPVVNKVMRDLKSINKNRKIK